MKVCIAEKPSVAREIASVLGANKKHNGYFEGNGYAVTYTFGHLCTLFEPKDYKPHWKSWDLNNLPMLPEKFRAKVVANEGILKQFNIVKNLFSKACVIINRGDAGPSTNSLDVYCTFNVPLLSTLSEKCGTV